MLLIMELWVGPTLAPDRCLALLHISPPNYCSILIFKVTAIHLFLLIATPSPVLGSFYLHTSNLCPSVHQDFTLEIRYLDPFHQLAIQ